MFKWAIVFSHRKVNSYYFVAFDVDQIVDFDEILQSRMTAYELVEKEQIRRVKPKEAQAVIEEGYKVLDIRPDWEYANASVDGSVHVPFFVEDEGMDPITLLKKSINMG
ncbi:hypothetical protein CYMTET_56071 [Cymbomonas tetramitiformis]|uniref:Rhodanese domain-containing protein n=1 Tax=Cymbomonas tetramitiformis TaxID=36881 RepID=A0AAE0BD02_9CHLO|nr:hypothetical protein CYMTET_56071 [Cymbomonas tetramitiformis]